MRLNEFLSKYFKWGVNETLIIEGDNLNKLLGKFLDEVDEFKNVESLSVGTTEGGTTIVMKDGVEFNKNVSISKIELTPQIYKQVYTTDPVKNGLSLTPVVYDLQTFEPNRSLVVNISNELMDNHDKTKLRGYLYEKVDQFMENPSDYEVKGFRNIIITTTEDSIKTINQNTKLLEVQI